MYYNCCMTELVHLGFRTELSKKERLEALAATQTEDGVGRVTVTDLLNLALDRLLDAEEKPRRKRR